jgi:hypothetical protein
MEGETPPDFLRALRPVTPNGQVIDNQLEHFAVTGQGGSQSPLPEEQKKLRNIEALRWMNAKPTLLSVENASGAQGPKMRTGFFRKPGELSQIWPVRLTAGFSSVRTVRGFGGDGDFAGEKSAA